MLFYIFMTIPTIIISLWASNKVKRYFKKYSKFTIKSGLTGYQVARRILDNSSLSNVKIESSGGFLSDHYDSVANVLRLSSKVSNVSSVAAVGIAAHEVGHAIQKAKKYNPLVIRQYLVPITQFSSWAFNILIFVGIFAASLFHIYGLVKIALIFLGITVLFSIITLPIEFDASKRAKNLLIKYEIVSADENKYVAKVLNAAALTYLAAAAGTIMTFLYYFFTFVSSDE